MAPNARGRKGTGLDAAASDALTAIDSVVTASSGHPVTGSVVTASVRSVKVAGLVVRVTGVRLVIGSVAMVTGVVMVIGDRPVIGSVATTEHSAGRDAQTADPAPIEAVGHDARSAMANAVSTDATAGSAPPGRMAASVASTAMSVVGVGVPVGETRSSGRATERRLAAIAAHARTKKS